MEYKTQKVAFIVLISILMAFLFAGRPDASTPRNDTAAYKSHYNCIVEVQKVDFCKRNFIGSSSWEIGYDYYSLLMNKMLGESSFYYYKLFTSFIICLALMFGMLYMSKGALVPFFLLLLDYRFYAYGGNILRHGLALSIAVLSVCYLISGSRLNRFLNLIIATSFHNSAAIFLFVIEKKLSVYISVFLLVLLSVFSFIIPDLIVSNKEFLLAFNEKIVTYHTSYGEKDFALPAHYMVAVVVGAYFYIFTKNRNFVIVQNVVFMLVFFTVIFSSIGIGDRIVAYASPFICVLFHFIVLEIYWKFERNNLVLILGYLFVGLGYLLMFYVHFEQFLTHFNIEGGV